MTRYPWMSYAAAHAHEAEAARLGVSAVARAPGGFMREYERAGTARAMEMRPLPSGVTGGETWAQKRHGFVARHMKSYAAHPTYRRYLALLMWAYRPPGRRPPMPASTERPHGPSALQRQAAGLGARSASSRTHRVSASARRATGS